MAPADGEDLVTTKETANGVPAPAQSLIRLDNIVKTFAGTIANDGVAFELRQGEVHALLGENGAGKTTLMNILYGLYHADSGDVYVRGQHVHFRSPADAIKHGIGMVHQSLRHIPTLTVVENVVLGLESGGLFLDLDTARNRVRELSDRYRLDIHPDAPMWQLSVGQQQRVEILKALYRDIRILILDEPTSMLTPYETEGLFAFMAQMADEGHGIVFISHKLDEVLASCQRVTVMRDGVDVETIEVPEDDQRKAGTAKQLARLMVGRDVVFRIDKPPLDPGRVVVAIQDLSSAGEGEAQSLDGLSLEVRRGEILGLAGVAGNGQAELAEVLTGTRRVDAGTVRLNDDDIPGLSPRQIIGRGVAFIPENSREMAILTGFSVEENTALKVLDQPAMRRGPFLRQDAIRSRARRLVAEFDVRAASLQLPAQRLSGGNLQKLVLACELSRDPSLIIGANPTAGLDVGAAEFVRNRLVEERGRGKAILLISSDLEELKAISDRIAVIFEGRIVGIISPDDADDETMGLLMAGAQRAHHAIGAVEDGANPFTQETQAPSRDEPPGAVKDEGDHPHWRGSVERIVRHLTDRSGWVSLGSTVLAVVLALLLVAALTAMLGVSPMDAYRQLFQSAFGTKNGIAETLVRATPLMLAALGIVISFRAAVWNIGAEGQIYFGALGATLAALFIPGLPAPLHVFSSILVGFLFGAAWGAIPALMRVYRGANEVITTLMLNFVAIFLIGYLVNWPLKDDNFLVPLPQSSPVPPSARLPDLIAGTRAHSGIIIAVLCSALVWVLLWRMAAGYRMRAVGANPAAARFGGINVSRQIVLALSLSGGMAGLAGVTEVIGLRGVLTDTLSPGYGFTAIAVALLAGLHPAGVIVSSVFLAALISGAEGLQRNLGIPSATIFIIQGLVLVFVIARRVLMYRK